ncbi:MAG: 2,3-bisphosphoglycerate-independent phosphoglycerate mutase [Chitinivibrionales bacterium]|nr:2,3-bisphosphoglycerate-independent phosphoglycerate mutase [Chitinivibrionales bacterium]
MKKKPVCLIIRDGWGRGNKEESNAIYMAKTPFNDYYESHFPTTEILTSGLSVGLPEGNQGNSEVGHLNIGAGRVIYQSLTRIDKSISDGDFFTNPAFLNAIAHVKQHHSTLHLIGLIQEEGVHAVTRHCLALCRLCKDNNLSSVLIHAITDGRDTPPKSALDHLRFLQDGIDAIGVGRVATVIGRYYAMDRDNRWERTEIGYRGLMQGIGTPVSTWNEAIEGAYREGQNDEFIKPRTIDYRGVGEHDAIIFFNFRFDRTRQLTKSIVEPDFASFQTVPHHVHFTAMTHYYDNGHFTEAFPEIAYRNIFGEIIAHNGLRQLRCAETEKYAHVTFFFNSLRNEPFPGEDRILVDSPKVATYDLQPAMSALAVRDKLVAAVKSDQYDVIITNFANCDMVGHTGVFDAIVAAVETVDTCVHDVVEAVRTMGGTAILFADHGNAEQTKLDDGSPMTAHTTNSVPLTLIGPDNLRLRQQGKLSDIAPTALQLLGIRQPVEMTGQSLIM